MSADEYSGWPNRETWLVALWLDNEPGTYEASRSITLRIVEEVRARYADRQGFVAAGESLAEYVADLAPDLGASLAADLLGHALARVDWASVAEAHTEEAAG